MVTGALPIFGRSAAEVTTMARLPVGRGRHQMRAGRLEGADGLRLGILEDVEVILGEIGDEVTFFVGDHDVERDEADVDFDLGRCGQLRRAEGCGKKKRWQDRGNQVRLAAENADAWKTKRHTHSAGLRAGSVLHGPAPPAINSSANGAAQWRE